MADKKIIDRYCPKCMSNNVYVDGEFFACRTCGNRWNPNLKPITKITEDEMSKKGICSNCGREKTLPYKDICGSCYLRIKGMDWDSPECKAALAQAKKDFNNPDRKQTHPRRRKLKKLPLEKIKEEKARVDAISNKSGLRFASIIGMIDADIKMHQKEIDKLNQAKQILI